MAGRTSWFQLDLKDSNFWAICLRGQVVREQEAMAERQEPARRKERSCFMAERN
jgi:hypothetical protein